MKTPPLARRLGSLTLALASLATLHANAQDPPARDDSVATIDADFQKALRQLERQRIERLAQLAERQPADDATATYQTLFQDALAAGLYREAEPTAERLLQRQGTPPQLRYLANLANILAEVDRNAFEESLASLEAAITTRKQRPRRTTTTPPLTPSCPRRCGSHSSKHITSGSSSPPSSTSPDAPSA